MSKVIVDDDLRSKLNGLNETFEFCEPSGKTVGHFVPHEKFLQLVYAWEKSTMSIDELKRRAAKPGGKSLAEIWKKLGRTT